jgi:ABC-2 type transport system permease protein
MLRRITNIVSLYRRLVSVQIRSQMQYRTAFWLDVLGTMAIMLVNFLSLALIFDRFGNLAGWTLGEIAFLWGMVETAFGLMDLVFSGFDPGSFGRRIRQGTFDQLLLRPAGITLQVLGDNFILRRLGRISQGLVILAIAFSLTDIQWTLPKLLYLPFVLFGLICYFGGLFVMGSTITFWTVESIEVVNVLTYGGAEMIAYPMDIYPDWLRRTFTYILPTIFLNYYPALFFLDKPDPFGMPAFASYIAPLVGLAILMAALAFWRYGISHYQSTGT